MPGAKKAVVAEVPAVETHAGSSSDQSPVRRRLHSDWESAVMRHVAPRVAELEEQAQREGGSEQRYGWESVGLRHLSRSLLAKGS